MILRIRNSRTFKGWALMLALVIFSEVVMPNQAFALTGGPAQPEFSSFTPIGTSDMVDLSSGDMNYNIPLLDVGGYPINLAYSSNVGMDQEASWVGLGWNLSVGQINRNVRGIPDDFNGDEMVYENHLKRNTTVGANFNIQPAALGISLGDVGGDVSIGMSAMYNSYTGFSLKPSAGISLDLGKAASVSFNVESSENGLSISPNVSLHHQSKKMAANNTKLSASFGTSFNSRQGLSAMTLNMSKKSALEQLKTKKMNFGNESGSASLGSTISFAEELYTPSKRVAMKTQSFTVNAAIGTEVFGIEGQGQITAYGTYMDVAHPRTTSPAYGYINTEQAGADGILDFNREKDGSVSVNTTNLPVTNYTYDVYSVQGQGVGGTYRPYRNQVGYVYDTKVVDNSNSSSLGVEVGAAQTAHVGVDFESTTVESSTQGWVNQNTVLQHLESDGVSGPNYEHVHYKNVGDLSADVELTEFKANTGNYQPVRIPFGGGEFGRTASSAYQVKNSAAGMSETGIAVTTPIKRTQRQARNQTINNLTFADLQHGAGYGPLSGITTLPAHAKSHHVAEVQIIRNDGARYIYGLPLYNTKKREVTMAVSKNLTNCANGMVVYNPAATDNPELLPDETDQYFNRTTTPGYVHTHLLTGILSTDYLDRENDGLTPDDFGSYTKFTYTDINEGEVYKWRVPFQPNTATHNPGLETNNKDDQGNYVYGEKELRYIKTIETKTHIAVFHVSPRHDALGVNGEHGGAAQGSGLLTMNRLDSISLYSIGEYYDAQGQPLANAVPIKTVHFRYSYDLCPGVPNNDGIANQGETNNGGKLTLDEVYFTYRNSKMGRYTGYEFDYDANPLTPSVIDGNPGYDIKGYDSWGNYLPANSSCAVNGQPSASEFPYTTQDPAQQNEYASSWLLRKISLPSGGEIKLTYESDEYAWVQNKAVHRMYKVAGASATNDPDLNNLKPELYSTPLGVAHNEFLVIDLDEQELMNLDGVNVLADAGTLGEGALEQLFMDIVSQPIYFRFYLNMTSAGGDATVANFNNTKFDYVSGYFEYNQEGSNGLAIRVNQATNQAYLVLKVRMVTEEDQQPANTNPIAKAGWHFGRKYLSSYVYSLNPNDEESDIESIAAQLTGASVLNSLKEIFMGPNGALKSKKIARRFVPAKSWVRLKDPDRKKLGGGSRVQQVRITDNWQEMTPDALTGTGSPMYTTMEYGQQYDYQLKDGRTSGVAAYEPIGNKENPFVQPVFAQDTKKLLAPDEENYVEKPFGESFFPAAQVTYSRVTVRNLNLGENPGGQQIKQLHKTGKVVTEFYTSKDYPTIVDQTKMQVEEDKSDLLSDLLNLNTKKHLTASQGYVIHLNDMNGKQKAQRVFAEGQDEAISGVDYIYDVNAAPGNFSAETTPEVNEGRLNNRVKVIRPDGSIGESIIGVEVDVVNDFRESKTRTEIAGVNTNLAAMLIGIIPIGIPIPLPDKSKSQDQFRSVSTTKIVNTFGILRQTIAYDAGAKVYTKNLAWDEATGEVLVTETVDEYNDKYYTLNYPAHWYYRGMGQAYVNLGFSGTLGTQSGSSFAVAELAGTGATAFFLPGDEVMLYSGAQTPIHAWITGVSGENILLKDKDGVAVGATGWSFKVMRASRRNLQSAGIMNVTLMKNPLKQLDGTTPATHLQQIFVVGSDPGAWKIINAGAVEYRDDWTVSCECGINDKEASYNPYAINEKGVWRVKSSRTYLTGRGYTQNVVPRVDGFFARFTPMYEPNGTSGWNLALDDWTKVAEVAQYSPYGFELENKDALNRYSAALYGYNNMFPTAVGANTPYKEIGFDGFEDRGYDEGCPYTPHFRFDGTVTDEHSHTGKHSIKIPAGTRSTLSKQLNCGDSDGPLDPYPYEEELQDER